MHIRNKHGMGLIEVVIGVTIITVGMLALTTSFNSYLKYALSNDKNIQAAYIMQEGMEGVSFLRDLAYSTNIQTLSTTTTYYLSWDTTNSYWKATTTPQYVDGIFLRQFSLTDVKRDATGAIASSGTYDPNSKQISLIISYFEGHATTSQTVSTYITNLYAN